MNDDAKKELETNDVMGIQDDFKIDPNAVRKVEEVISPVEGGINQPTVNPVALDNQSVEVASESTSVETNVNEVPTSQENSNVVVSDNTNQEEKTTPTVASETVINADINVEVEESKEELAVGSIEEVSVTVDSNTFNTLSETEVAADSVFNKPTTTTEIVGMKEGQEHLNEKKGFPYFMVFVFVAMVVVAFFIDDIVAFVEKVQTPKAKPETTEETPKQEEDDDENKDKVEAKNISLEEIKTVFANSSDIIDFEKANNIELEIVINDNVVTFTTTNYLDPTSPITTLKVDYTLTNNILATNCDLSNTEFGRQMSIFLVKEIAKLQGVAANELDTYIEENLYTSTIDKGFEFTNSEDGNNFYQIATNIKLDITK